MCTVITVCFAVVMMIYGITELLRRIWLYFTRPKDDPPRVMTVFLKSGIYAAQLRSAIEYLSWENENLFKCIAAVDCGLTDEEREKAKAIADQHYNIVFGKDALENLINCKDLQVF